MSSNMRIGAITASARSKFTLLGSLAACGGVVLLAFGCSSADTATQAPAQRRASRWRRATTARSIRGRIATARPQWPELRERDHGRVHRGTLKCAPDNSCKFDMSGCTQPPAVRGRPRPARSLAHRDQARQQHRHRQRNRRRPRHQRRRLDRHSDDRQRCFDQRRRQHRHWHGHRGRDDGHDGPSGQVQSRHSAGSRAIARSGGTARSRSWVGRHQDRGGYEAVEGPTAPMLVYWHGTGSTSGEYAVMAAPVADGRHASGGVIVSFQGTTGGDLYSGTNIFGAGDLTSSIDSSRARSRSQRRSAQDLHDGLQRRRPLLGRHGRPALELRRGGGTNSGGWHRPASFQNRHTPSAHDGARRRWAPTS